MFWILRPQIRWRSYFATNCPGALNTHDLHRGRKVRSGRSRPIKDESRDAIAVKGWALQGLCCHIIVARDINRSNDSWSTTRHENHCKQNGQECCGRPVSYTHLRAHET